MVLRLRFIIPLSHVFFDKEVGGAYCFAGEYKVSRPYYITHISIREIK